MPIYEYQCNECQQTFDALQKLNDAPLTACRQCGATGVRKLLSAPAFRLKGSGWYETDFKKDGQRNVAKSDADSASGADKSGGDKGGSDKGGSDKSSAGGSSEGGKGSDGGASGSSKSGQDKTATAKPSPGGKSSKPDAA